MDKREQLPRLQGVLRQQRWAALATVDGEGEPAASMVAYALAPRSPALYLHLSRLAAHTGHLLRHPACALVISEADPGSGDPQQLARLSLQGRVTALARHQRDYPQAKEAYLERLPDARPRFDFTDFTLFRFDIVSARFVGGFGQAYSYRAADLCAATGDA